MTRRGLACVAAALCALCAAADVSVSDIVRHGLLRKADILPANATMSFSGGVLRVVETRTVTDTNRVVFTVTTNMVPVFEPETWTLTNGVYLSLGGVYGAQGVDFAIPWGGEYSALSCRIDGTSMNEGTNYFKMIVDPAESAAWGSTNAWNKFPDVLVGVWPTNAPPAGRAVVDYYRYRETVTNEFYAGGNYFFRDSYTNLIWQSVYSNGWHFLTPYTNTP